MRPTLSISIMLLIATGCTSERPDGVPLDEGATAIQGRFQGMALTGDSLFSAPARAAVEVQQPLLSAAEARLQEAPDDPNSWIWVARRLGYLQQYGLAIQTLSEGLDRFPEDPRLYRHRGHRYLSTRKVDDAIRDLTRAGELIQGTEDEVEPDGLPNARGIPTSTLHYNIWYHLALAHFIRGDFEMALDAYEKCLDVSTNPDALVATSYWMFMTLERLGRRTEAAALLEPITEDLDIIENGSYRDLLLLFKGERTPEDVIPPGEDSLAGATTLFGVAHWHRRAGRIEDADDILDRALQMKSQWPAFGYIAAEADVSRR